MKHCLRALWIGRRNYEHVRTLQLQLLEARKLGHLTQDIVLLLEHDPTVTLGRGAKADHLLISRDALTHRGVSVCETDRGGDVTYHGPGQLVGYPIVDLAPDRCDVRRYVRALMQTMTGLCADAGVSAGVITRHPGVWVDEASPERWQGEESARSPAKIGAVGVRISRWVTMHGFAFNARPNMDGFATIVPCGIREFGVTSLRQLGRDAPEPAVLAHRAAELLASQLESELVGFETELGSEQQIQTLLLGKCSA